MANEDPTLQEAMEYLKEAGQRIRATQSLMRSQGMSKASTTATYSRASLQRSPWTEAAYLEARRRRDL